ncbi:MULTISPECIES: hypothetical protein [Sphingomonas]|uniref:DUF3618 domain-containing protein n=1 Tax=Sphingomonas bisphenolicum TaxID=296544 RepID=A0ABN5WKM8_9SPHN|nr:hypothetical protein [Sphingomonas bisphenolicum]MBA4091875.1 hypothetical protein [Sphingobium sp.]BBF70820.1 hypothetical protein SBA_ch1_30200 [Sphingomonas bisphenolicum]
MNLETRYRQACERADAARGRLDLAAKEAKARVAPARLKQDVKDKASNAMLNGMANVAAQAQQRPVAIGAAAAAFGLFLARRPLAALFRRLYVRFQDTQTDNSENDDG